MNPASMPHLTARERQAIRAFVHQVYERFPGEILSITLFGSKARGDSRPGSDIDILTIVRQESWPLREEISTMAARVSLEYAVLIGPRVIGQERWERMGRDGFSLYENIIAEGISLVPALASS